jgi:uncharacterized protein YegP (UPF0339 family)
MEYSDKFSRLDRESDRRYKDMVYEYNQNKIPNNFHLKSKNGEVILSSFEDYISDKGVKIGIDYVRRNATESDRRYKDMVYEYNRNKIPSFSNQQRIAVKHLNSLG